LVGHAWPITGNGSDPLSELTLPYTWIGHLAVSGFFAISGYLVTASIQQRSLSEFAVSRVLRLYPAVLVYLAISVFIIGPIASSVPVKTYLQAEPWNNFLNGWLWEWNYNLPYVFENSPRAGATNGSAWTLPVELRCYILVFLMGFVGLFDSRLRANVALIFLLFLLNTNYSAIPLFGHDPHFSSPLYFFVVGSLFWINRDLILLNWPAAAILLLALCLLIPLGLNPIFRYLFPFGSSYLVFMLVYRVKFINIDRFGDISYGIYIYAWPVQQLVWRPEQSAMMNIALSTIIVIPVAYLSWRFIEKPCLSLRNIFARKPVSRSYAS